MENQAHSTRHPRFLAQSIRASALGSNSTWGLRIGVQD